MNPKPEFATPSSPAPAAPEPAAPNTELPNTELTVTPTQRISAPVESTLSVPPQGIPDQGVLEGVLPDQGTPEMESRIANPTPGFSDTKSELDAESAKKRVHLQIANSLFHMVWNRLESEANGQPEDSSV